MQVLHCGDFGFYSEERLEELPERELALRIRHSEKVAHLKNKAFGMSREAKIGTNLITIPHHDALIMMMISHSCVQMQRW